MRFPKVLVLFVCLGWCLAWGMSGGTANVYAQPERCYPDRDGGARRVNLSANTYRVDWCRCQIRGSIFRRTLVCYWEIGRFILVEPTPVPTEVPTAVPSPVPTVSSTSSRSWIQIGAGNFTMGSDETDLQQTLDECNNTEGSCQRDWFAGETPERRETTSAYSIMRYEVTNGEYGRCVDSGACTAARKSFRNNAEAESAGYFDPEYPVTGVTWYDASDYCSWVGGRLPTELEWEKAARGTDGRRYPWGDSWQAGKANLHTYQLSPVGSFPTGSSPYGVDDMAGNVVEWTATIDQSGRSILRGGGFENNYFRGRTTDRGTKLQRDFANFDIGFRCVR